MAIKISHVELILGALMLVVAGAAFTGTAVAQYSQPFDTGFTEGSLAISGSLDHPLFGGRPIVPGDHESTKITVTNDGSLALRYAVTSTTTEDVLAPELELTIWDATEEADNCDSTPAMMIYGPAPLGDKRGLSVVGDAAQGAQTGDRTLAAGDSR